MIMNRATGDDRHDHWEVESSVEDLHVESSHVTPQERVLRYGQTPATVLLTGLVASGKTTIAYALERRLFDVGRASTVLDGRGMRLGISRDLGFTAEDRSENLRRSAEVAKLINDAGLICVAAFVAPDDEVRKRAAEVVGTDRFFVVHIATPLGVCRTRDEDGHYEKADSGEIANFPGVSAAYNAPESADLVLNAATMTPDQCVDQLMDLLSSRGIID
jgi:bifunctional enzyme CysN/CysC